jgi:enamine deaminase RidA (YjgF/YER057c/UK114 family)
MSDTTRRHQDGREEKAGYSRAVRRRGRIAVSGTTATGQDGLALHPGDTYQQTRAALQRALAGMHALGGRLEDVVRTRVYLAPDADWEGAARAHAELLGPVAPANTMIYVARLIGDSFLVEVELEAEASGP